MKTSATILALYFCINPSSGLHFKVYTHFQPTVSSDLISSIISTFYFWIGQCITHLLVCFQMKCARLAGDIEIMSDIKQNFWLNALWLRNEFLRPRNRKIKLRIKITNITWVTWGWWSRQFCWQIFQRKQLSSLFLEDELEEYLSDFFYHSRHL